MTSCLLRGFLQGGGFGNGESLDANDAVVESLPGDSASNFPMKRRCLMSTAPGDSGLSSSGVCGLGTIVGSDLSPLGVCGDRTCCAQGEPIGVIGGTSLEILHL